MAFAVFRAFWLVGYRGGMAFSVVASVSSSAVSPSRPSRPAFELRMAFSMGFCWRGGGSAGLRRPR